MNKFDYKTGKLFINNKSYELTKQESEILNLLLDNKLKTYIEIYNRVYKTNIKTIERKYSQSINAHISRMRKKGLNIISKYNYGMRLLDDVHSV